MHICHSSLDQHEVTILMRVRSCVRHLLAAAFKFIASLFLLHCCLKESMSLLLGTADEKGSSWEAKRFVGAIEMGSNRTNRMLHHRSFETCRRREPDSARISLLAP